MGDHGRGQICLQVSDCLGLAHSQACCWSHVSWLIHLSPYRTCSRLIDWEFSRNRAHRVEGDNGQIPQTVTLSLDYLSRLQTIRLQLLASPYYAPGGQPTPDSTKTLKSLTKFIRHIGKWYEGLMHLDPKTFVSIPGTVGAIGWWWSEVTSAIQQGEKPAEGE